MSVHLQHMLMEKLNSGIHLTLMSLLISSVMSSLQLKLLNLYMQMGCHYSSILVT